MGEAAPLEYMAEEASSLLGQEGGGSSVRPYEETRSWTQYFRDMARGGNGTDHPSGVSTSGTANPVLKVAGVTAAATAGYHQFHEGVKDIGNTVKGLTDVFSHHKSAPPSTPATASRPNTWDALDYNPPPININVYAGRGSGLPKNHIDAPIRKKRHRSRGHYTSKRR